MKYIVTVALLILAVSVRADRLGSTDTTSQVELAAEYVVLSQFTATANGTIDSIGGFVRRDSVRFIIGIGDTTSGLSQVIDSTSPQPLADDWTEKMYPAVNGASITNGTTYWIGAQVKGGASCYIKYATGAQGAGYVDISQAEWSAPYSDFGVSSVQTRIYAVSIAYTASSGTPHPKELSASAGMGSW